MLSGDDDDDEDLVGNGELFKEPEDFYPPPKPATVVEHELISGDVLKLRLVGHNPLWGHLLWNAARTIAAYLEDHADNLIAGRDILELGAGAGLPSLVCASNGARRVVVTDYPDLDLIENLTFNVENCGLRIEIPVYTEGFLWGTAPDKLLAHLDNNYAGFDIVVLADLLFNHSEHSKLVSSVQQTLKKSATARALVFFTPYRPWLLAKDMAFFDIVQDAGLVVTKVLEMTMEKVMFEEDPGDERLRRTVFGYELSWREHC